MSSWPQFSVRSLFFVTTGVAMWLAVCRIFELSIVQSLCAVAAFPAFAFGPFMLIWAGLDWRPVLQHRRRWALLAISFGTLLANPWGPPIFVEWWLANIPGYLIFWVVANFKY